MIESDFRFLERFGEFLGSHVFCILKKIPKKEFKIQPLTTNSSFLVVCILDFKNIVGSLGKLRFSGNSQISRFSGSHVFCILKKMSKKDLKIQPLTTNSSFLVVCIL